MFTKSQKHYQKAKNIIPLGSQTYSKSILQYPYGVSPLYAERADKSYIWDMDGNKFVDLVGSLWTVGLGYNDPDVMHSIKDQLSKGTIFSLSHSIEYEVAELIVDLVPCAEMLRFAKNGTDVTSAAIKLARAYTDRDHIAICGYHGWQDWYISTTNKNRGIPDAVSKLSHRFIYNDIQSLIDLFDCYPNQIAAVILEPMNVSFPKGDFLKKVKDICELNNAILIFDEIVTGFRMSIGGAQEYFGVTPHLATFGKSIANGMPLSVLAGKKELMSLFDDVYFSGTFGGETLSLAAAKAVLLKLQQEPIVEKIYKHGDYLSTVLTDLINKHNLQSYLEFSGHPHWKHLMINHADALMIKSFILKECFCNGLLTLGPSYINYAMTMEDIKFIIETFDNVLQNLKETFEDNSLSKKTSQYMLKPVFTVR